MPGDTDLASPIVPGVVCWCAFQYCISAEHSSCARATAQACAGRTHPAAKASDHSLELQSRTTYAEAVGVLGNGGLLPTAARFELKNLAVEKFSLLRWRFFLRVRPGTFFLIGFPLPVGGVSWD